MENENYNDEISETISDLDMLCQKVIRGLYHLTFQGEMKDFYDSYREFEANEWIPFDFDLLNSIEDPNVQSLLKLSEKLIGTIDSLSNLNNIDLGDFEQEEPLDPEDEALFEKIYKEENPGCYFYNYDKDEKVEEEDEDENENRESF